MKSGEVSLSGHGVEWKRERMKLAVGRDVRTETGAWGLSRGCEMSICCEFHFLTGDLNLRPREEGIKTPGRE